MKKHISITVSPDALHLAQRVSLEDHRSLSQVFELAVLSFAQQRFIRDRDSLPDVLPVSDTAFNGTVRREDAYGERIS
ncbi:MAG: hypothetical protein EA427_13385 [Spirochaetaceae bacterium]|nr:MAG: hypothetical protein EA427_13385 [Spirochaetaceae bacterium]